MPCIQSLKGRGYVAVFEVSDRPGWVSRKGVSDVSKVHKFLPWFHTVNVFCHLQFFLKHYFMDENIVRLDEEMSNRKHTSMTRQNLYQNYERRNWAINYRRTKNPLKPCSWKKLPTDSLGFQTLVGRAPAVLARKFGQRAELLLDLQGRTQPKGSIDAA